MPPSYQTKSTADRLPFAGYLNRTELANGKATEYGMGFFSGTDEFGRFYYGHGGGSIGGCGNLIIYPEEKVVVAVITNDSNAKVGKEVHKLAEIFLTE